MGKNVTKSGVMVSDNFRDNLIISKYDNQFIGMRDDKKNKMCSENSEDVLTWNVFKSLAQIDSTHWLPKLFEKAFNSKFSYDTLVKIDLWKSIEPPPSITDFQKDEGNSEIDITIESKNFVWFIEAKYKSDISLTTTHNENRDQLLRNIDVGSYYSSARDFYFSLLYFDGEKTKEGLNRIELYHDLNIENIKTMLPHRSDKMDNVKGIGKIQWSDIDQKYDCTNDFETFINTELQKYLKGILSKA
jgi:hypothetical protein